MTGSALEVEFVVHHRDIDATGGKWTGVRVRKLCNLLSLTQAELARLIRLPPHRLTEYITSGKFPPCVLLLLNLVERSAFRKYLGTVYNQPLFPSGF